MKYGGKVKAFPPQFVEKVCFLNKSAYPQSLSPLGHSVGFASCKAWCVLISASLPKTTFPRKGAEYGAAALTPLGATPQTPILRII